MLIYKLKALFHPERYHGWGKTKRYFEGWYYKVVNESEDRAFAFIPGISMDENGNQQAFIQILDGKKLTAAYHTFHAQEFQTKAGIFEVRLANNIFTCENIQLDLPGIKGALNFVNQVAWPNKWYSPGIMGPYSFVPFMECYHGIISMDHSIKGELKINNKELADIPTDQRLKRYAEGAIDPYLETLYFQYGRYFFSNLYPSRILS